MTCTKTGSKNDLSLHCRRKTKELSKKELSNVAPASCVLGLKKTLRFLKWFHLQQSCFLLQMKSFIMDLSNYLWIQQHIFLRFSSFVIFFSIHRRNSIQDNFQQQLQNLICIIQNLNILRHIFPQIIKLPVHSISIYSFKLSPHFSY